MLLWRNSRCLTTFVGPWVNSTVLVVALFVAFAICVHIGTALAHSPHDPIEAIAVSPAYDRDRTLFVVVHRELKRSTDAGASWSKLERGLENRVPFSSLAISPDFEVDGTIFLATDGDGIYQSTDGGSHWRHLETPPDGLGLKNVVVAPNFAERPIVATLGADGRLFQSRDGGNSWSPLFHEKQRATAVLIGHERLWVAADDGRLLVSPDGTTSWSEMPWPRNEGEYVTALAAGSADADDGLWIGTSSGRLLRWWARDGNFQVAAEVPSEEPRAVVSIAAGPDGVVCAVTWHMAAYCSRDGGQSWAVADEGLTKIEQADRYHEPHFTQVIFSPHFADDRQAFVAGFNGLFQTTDAMDTWHEIQTRPADSIEGLSVVEGIGGELTIGIVTLDAGAYISFDSGENWSALNDGLADPHVWDIHVVPAKNRPPEALAISNFAFYRLFEGNASWELFFIRQMDHDRDRAGRNLFWRGMRAIKRWIWGQDGIAHLPFPTVIATYPDFPDDPRILLGSRQDGIYSSRDLGETWETIWTDVGDWVTDLLILPDQGQGFVLVAGTQAAGLWRSTDGGETWHAAGIGGDPHPVDPNEFRAPVLAESLSSDGDSIILAGTADGLYRSHDFGMTWTRIEIAAHCGDYVRALAISPDYAHDQTFFASVMGCGLFRTNDGGSSFVRSDIGFASRTELFKRLEISPRFAMDHTLFGVVGEDLVVSRDAGQTWSVLPRSQSLVRARSE